MASSSSASDSSGASFKKCKRQRRGDVSSWRIFASQRFIKKYNWLDVRQDGVYCLFCSTHSRASGTRSNTFVTEPYTGTRPDLLTKHSLTQLHQENASINREALQRTAKKKTIENVLDESDCLTVEGRALCDAIRCMYFLMKKEIAHTTNFGPLRDLCVIMGNTTMPKLDIAKNCNFRSEQTMHEIVVCIGSVLENEKVKLSPYFSIIADESTDISVHKQLALAVQYLCLETATVKTRYLKLLDMSGPGKEASVTGETLSEAIRGYLQTHALDLTKLIGASCDGAAVMLGQRHGAMTYLKQFAPELIVTHCSAHRLALASCDAAAKCPWFSRFEKVLNQVYSYFSHSAVRYTKLAEMQSVLSLPQLKLQRPTETRWLSLEGAIHAFRRCFVAVQAVLEDEGSKGCAMALGLAKFISTHTFRAQLYFLSDVLSILGILSLTFQTKDLNLLTVEKVITHHVSTLQSLKENPFSGGYMMELETTYSETLNELDKSAFIKHCEDYLEALITNIQSRFPNVHVVSLLGLLDPRNCKNAKPDLVMELAELFGMNGPMLWNEFMSYMSLVLTKSNMTLIEAVRERTVKRP